MDSKALFAADFFKNNRAKLRKQLPDSLIVISANGRLQKSADQEYPFRQNSNFWYLTGVDAADFILVMDGEKDYLIAPELSDYLKVFYGHGDNDKFKLISGADDVVDQKNGWKILVECLKKSKQIAVQLPPPVFVNPYGFYTNPAQRRLLKRLRSYKFGQEIIDIKNHLSRLRMVKQPPELAAIQTAIDYTAGALDLIKGNLAKYNNESEIEAELTYYFNKNQVSHAFDPIIANGQRAATIHYNANNKNIDHSQITLIDTGAIYQNYSADISRSFCLNPNARQKAVYDAVLDVQAYAFGLLKPGVMIRNYEEKAALYMGRKLKELGLIDKIEPEIIRKWYPQMTSHSLGLDLHDATDYDLPLEPGMVLTVEPGIYIKSENIGVRVEDDVLITKNGIDVMSKNLSRRIDSITIKQL